MRRASIRLFWAVALPAAALPGLARAEGKDALALAKEKVEAAALLDEQGNYEGALKLAGEATVLAEAIAQLPALTLYTAQLLVKAGKFVEAQERYRSIIALDIDNLKPPPKVQPWEWRKVQKEAQATAKKELEALTRRIPLLKVTVTGADPSIVKVTVDGRPLQPAQLDQHVPLNPGRHTITAEAPGKVKATREVELKERGTVTVTLTLAPVPGPPASGSATVPFTSIVAWSVGGAGLVAGAIAAGFVLSERSRSAEVCNLPGINGGNNGCPHAYLDSMYIASHISTAGFGVAAAGVLAGTTVFVLASRKAGPKPVGLALGPAFLSVKGSF